MLYGGADIPLKGGFILDRMIEILEEKEEISDLDVSAAWNTARKEVENRLPKQTN